MPSLLLALAIALMGPSLPQPRVSLPDAPEPQVTEPVKYRVVDMSHVGFFTFRRQSDPPLRTNLGVFDKKFIAVHAMYLAAVIAAVRNPRSGETKESELPVVPALTGLDFLVSKYVCECMSVEAPIYAIQHYARAASK